MSELSAAELLLETEEQLQYFPTFTRGLTAILLYYDTKKLAASNLKLLTLARKGRTWTFNDSLPADITKFATDLVDKQLQDDLIFKLLGQIEAYDWCQAEERLLKV